MRQVLGPVGFSFPGRLAARDSLCPMNLLSSPAVSVVMPVRNAATTITRAIASIRGQTWTSWEMVLVDDGSTDGTPEQMRAAARADSRLRMLSSPARGIAAALNAGLAIAQGDFVARMDADDEAQPTRLAEQIGFLRAHDEIGLVGCLVEFGGDRGMSGGYALHVDPGATHRRRESRRRRARAVLSIADWRSRIADFEARTPADRRSRSAIRNPQSAIAPRPAADVLAYFAAACYRVRPTHHAIPAPCSVGMCDRSPRCMRD